MHVLMIGDPAAPDAAVLGALSHAGAGSFVIETAPTPAAALRRIRSKGIQAVIVDLPQAHPHRVPTIETLWRDAPHLPVLVVSDSDDAETFSLPVPRSTCGFIARSRVDRDTLPLALKDLVDRKAEEERRFFEQQRSDVMLNSIGDAVLSVDAAGRITYLNPAAESIIGWKAAEAEGRLLNDILQLLDAETRQPIPDPMIRAMRMDRVVRVNNGLLTTRGGGEVAVEDSSSPIHDRTGRVIGAVLVFKDVTAQQTLARQVAHLARHDFLTDLPNRVVLYDRLTQAIALARRYGHHLAVLFLDLDRFKQVNDTLGHVTGDALLQSVGRRLLASVRASDTVCRMGGDEFVILLSEIEAPDDAAILARKIITTLAAPHEVAGYQLQVAATVGISVYPDHGPDPESLIRAADTAMYHARETGGQNFLFFDPPMHARAAERLWIETSLQVLREACAQARTWIDAGRLPMSISVNISRTEFRHPGFVQTVADALAEHRLEGRYLELELTEGALIHDPDGAVEVLRALDALGVQLALDDFGTGYSSLSNLRQFPIAALKIDRTFVQEIADDPGGMSLVRAVIGMGRMLGHRVVAEGIETPEQLAFLQSEVCAEGQGYYFSPPLGADQFAVLSSSSPPGVIFH